MLGVLYPFLTLVAIIATVNRFILDAVRGVVVCGIGWNANSILLNLLPLEDHFLRCLKMHKHVIVGVDAKDDIGKREEKFVSSTGKITS